MQQTTPQARRVHSIAPALPEGLQVFLGVLAGTVAWISALGLVSTEAGEPSGYRAAAGLIVSGVVIIALITRRSRKSSAV